MPRRYDPERFTPSTAVVGHRVRNADPRVTDESVAACRFVPETPFLPPETAIARGLIVVDKPAGCTSHDVVDRVRRLLRIKRVGHSGTLDPEVTGVLPLGLGQATRMLGLLLGAGKTYDCEMTVHADTSADTVTAALMAQIGTITQLPPIRSRVKRVQRERDIYALDVREISGRSVRFTVRCEAGTYIRKLCHDVGEVIGTRAHMARLRRTEAGGFTLDDAVTLDTLQRTVEAWRSSRAPTAPATSREFAESVIGADVTAAAEALTALIWPMECALPADLPRVWLDSGAAASVARGAGLAVPGVIAVTSTLTAEAPCALQITSGHLLALGTAEMDAATFAVSRRGILARPHKVFWPLGQDN